MTTSPHVDPAHAAPNPSPLTIERLFEAPDVSGPSPRSPRFAPDGSSVSYLKARADDPAVFDLWSYDIAARRHRLLVDSRQLAPEERPLSAEEEARRERQRIAALRGIVEYSWSPTGRGLLFPLGGDLYYYDLGARGAGAVKQLTNTQAYETDARFSPRGRYISFVRDQNLHVIDLATGRERALTTEGGGLVSLGVAEFVAQEEIKRSTGYWWSPDEREIAVTRVDESRVREVERFEVDADGFRVFHQRYPAAGTPNADVSLGVIAVESGTLQWLDLGPERDIYLARVDWFPESDALLVQRQSRDQKKLDLLRYDTNQPGSGRLLFSETSKTWVELHDNLRFLASSRQLLWSSSRSGHDHLYLYDYDGRLLNQVTAGDWDIAGDFTDAEVRGVDARARLVYFTANEKTPIERHLYVASLDTRTPETPTRVTQGDGWHSIAMSPDAKHFLQSYSDPQQPPQLSLHDRSGKRIAWLVENKLDASHPYWPYRQRHVAPEYGTLAASDGKTLHWQMLRPPGFDPARRYPAIVMVYGGPGVQMVQRRWGDRRGNQVAQVIASHGYVVFALDNRGSGGRGQAFADPIYLNMGGPEVADQLRGVDYLRSLPWVDSTRLGAYGWSYGGYMTLMLLMKSPGTFRAGVSGAPVTDWSLYDTHYTERYLGDPQTSPEVYRQSGVLSHVSGLRDRLLVMHGMADDNVLFTNSTKLFKALVGAKKPFLALPYPGSKHAALSFRDTGPHGWNAILDFFDLNLAPHADGTAP
ncbi:MAG: S9 family peptidase [Gammaproteobacteria bacterium]|nr:S9 family peptidase [Gammaproteobacteria bacterium]